MGSGLSHRSGIKNKNDQLNPLPLADFQELGILINTYVFKLELLNN